MSVDDASTSPYEATYRQLIDSLVAMRDFVNARLAERTWWIEDREVSLALIALALSILQKLAYWSPWLAAIAAGVIFFLPGRRIPGLVTLLVGSVLLAGYLSWGDLIEGRYRGLERYFSRELADGVREAVSRGWMPATGVHRFPLSREVVGPWIDARLLGEACLLDPRRGLSSEDDLSMDGPRLFHGERLRWPPGWSDADFDYVFDVKDGKLVGFYSRSRVIYQVEGALPAPASRESWLSGHSSWSGAAPDLSAGTLPEESAMAAAPR